MKKILIVDDAQADRQNLYRILTDAGCLVITAANGAEALNKARTELPELILMDVNMPGVDGFSVSRQLSQDAGTKKIPIIFVTGKDQKADRVFAQMLGAKGYITKPYTPQQLFEQIGQV